MMEILFEKGNRFITANGRKIVAWSKVRNELNGLRPRANEPDLFRTTPDSIPSMPRSFPVGDWKITKIIPHPNKIGDGYLYPFFIATDAFQMLDEWSLDNRGFYSRSTGKKIKDIAYGIHFSISDWTQGCIRVRDESDLRWLIDLIRPELETSLEIKFVVRN